MRDWVQHKAAELKYISVKEKIMDIFTKAVAKDQFLALKDRIASPLNIKEEKED